MTKDTRNIHLSHLAPGRHYSNRRPPRNRLPGDVAFVVFAGICIGLGVGIALGMAITQLIAAVQW
jgi:hypothetical protein